MIAIHSFYSLSKTWKLLGRDPKPELLLPSPSVCPGSCVSLTRVSLLRSLRRSVGVQVHKADSSAKDFARTAAFLSR